ncbi:hypothetical protein BDW71DRAFT_212933 [Aspergillus fruticulosus]
MACLATTYLWSILWMGSTSGLGSGSSSSGLLWLLACSGSYADGLLAGLWPTWACIWLWLLADSGFGLLHGWAGLYHLAGSVSGSISGSVPASISASASSPSSGPASGPVRARLPALYGLSIWLGIWLYIYLCICLSACPGSHLALYLALGSISVPASGLA